MAYQTEGRSEGFTLLELILAFGILSLMTITIATATRQALRTRQKVQEKVAEMSQVRDALKIIQRDLELAYHARDLEAEVQAEVKKLKNKNPSNPNSNNPTDPSAPPPVAGIDPNTGAPTTASDKVNPYRKNPETDFIGKESEVYFATKNAPVFLENAPQADFAKVGYQISSCRKPGSNNPSSNCLIRRYSALVEGDITKTDSGTVLVENVTNFKLRYYGAGKQDYVSSWSSKDVDASMMKKYPESVEITLEIAHGEGNEKRTTSMQITAQVRFPNNREISQASP